MNRSEICPDGSDRRFSRTIWNGRSAVSISPAPGSRGLREAQSFYLIGRHLYGKGVPVPRIYSYCSTSGMLIVEDLGDTKFQHVALGLLSKADFSSLLQMYKKVLDLLVHMQFEGAKAFDTSWCWQDPIYDSRLAWEKEALYFMEAFIKGFLGMDCDEDTLLTEFEGLTRQVDVLDLGYFLHRDFQSRNLMVTDGVIRVIDFQGGRLGPWGYDLASIIHDPYVNLPWDVRQALYEYYLSKTEELGKGLCRECPRKEFTLLAILRLLQALGAYGALSMKKGKAFFVSFMLPALESLRAVLETWHETSCICLISCVRRAVAELS